MDENMKKLGKGELIDRLGAAAREKERLEKQIEEKRALTDKLLGQLKENQAQLKECQARLNDTQDQLAAAKDEIVLRREEKEAAVREAESLRAQLAEAAALLTAEREALRAAEERAAAQGKAEAAQEQELDALRKECAGLKTERDSLSGALARRELACGETGSIAEAAIKVAGVFEQAQEAADMYLLNIEKMLAEQKKACMDMAEKARAEADELIARAGAHCEEMKREAQAYCEAQRRQADEDGRQRRQALSEHLNRIRSEIMDSFVSGE